MATSSTKARTLVVIEVKLSGELLFRELVDGTWLASPVQVYLDLMHGAGRARGNGEAPAPRKDRFLMTKPSTFDGYTDQHTVDCERVLVTLLRGLGPWKESVFLVGGLTPRYLVAARPPAVPPHAGTLDVDIVIALQILADTEGYNTLEGNLRRMRFERSTNDKGQKLSWRWQTRTEQDALIVLELLADAARDRRWQG